MDEELDRFKELDLRQVAGSIGYVVDRRESSRNSTVMRRDHDKIIVSLKPDGHYTYWSPRDEADHGTVIDFLMRRKNLSLGGVRKELRAWAKLPAPPRTEFPALSKSTKNLDAVRERLAAMAVAGRHPYLEEVRKIPVEVLQDRRFAGRIRIDARGAAAFPHADAEGRICGYELKNKASDGGTFTGFSPHGRKGIFMSNSTPSDRRLVLTESGIEALSYAAIFGGLETTRFGSIAGKPTPVQRAIMRAAMLDMPGGSVIIAATNADEAGGQLAKGMKEIFDECGRTDLTFRRDEPFGAKDWNDILLGKTKRTLPIRPEEPHVA